ncbi:MAG: TonB-dependent receptor [Gammaproteobacteria bacterium]|nr:TonB-dependent receptor [Gammaproteobacteria bacterium]
MSTRLRCSDRVSIVCVLSIAVTPVAVLGQQAPQEGERNSAAPAALSDLDVVTVTAQRRSERVQDVPLSITALSGSQLESSGINNSQALASITPGVVMASGAGNAQPAIRGISSSGTGPSEAPNVATYVDGVLQPNQKANFFDFPDTQRIEILKGPQGTLFGANATGGAIRIFTIDPSSTFSGQVNAGYGNHNDELVSGWLRGPVADRLDYSLSGMFERRDGFSKDLLHNDDPYGDYQSAQARAKLRYRPTDDGEITLAAHFANRHDPDAFAGLPLNGNTVAVAIDPNAIYGKRPWETAQNLPSYVDSKEQDISATVDWDLGFASLKSISALQTSNNKISSDLDYSNIPVFSVFIQDYNNTISEELNLTSKSDGPLGWSLGYYYFDNRTYSDPLGYSTGVDIYARGENKSNSVFGELSYKIMDRLYLIAGARYSHEKVSSKASLNDPDTQPLGQAGYNSVTPRASLRYELTDDSNVYATYSRGFKSGLFSGYDFSTTPVNPETVNAYEVGFKKSAPSWTLNLASYYYDYRNLQFSQYQGIVVLYKNVGNARVYGLEADGTYKLGGGLSARFGAAYLNGIYVSFPGAPAQIPTGFGGNEQVAVDASGQPMIRAPRWTGDLGLYYDAHAGVVPVQLSVNGHSSSRYYFETSYRISQPSYVQLDTQVRVRPDDTSPWSLQLWARNLMEVARKEAVVATAFGDMVEWSPPRTFGASVRYEW